MFDLTSDQIDVKNCHLKICGFKKIQTENLYVIQKYQNKWECLAAAQVVEQTQHRYVKQTVRILVVCFFNNQ